MALSKLAVIRLTKLADFMDALPRKAWKHFDMEYWLAQDGEDHHKFGDYIEPSHTGDCGTTACAAGWAATIPSFRRAGFKLIVSRTSWSNWGRIEKFFDLPGTESEQVFGASNARQLGIKTPKQWAKHCRKFIRANA